MRPILTVEQMRAVDARESAAVGEGVLIERAAFAVATTAIEMLGGAYGREITVLAGSGHNGADGIRAGALLAARGAKVSILRSSAREGDEHSAAAWAAARSAGAREVSSLGLADLVIDAMVGVGARAGALSGAAADLVSELSDDRVLAVDIPSGIDADTGAVNGAAVCADVTVTFGALKRGLLVGAGAELAGQVVLAPIGFGSIESDVQVLDVEDAARYLRDPRRDDDKRKRGVVGVVAGSASYPGAGLLTVGGAVRSGAGYVRVPGAATEVLAAFPSAVAADGSVDVWVGGSGVDRSRLTELEQRWDSDAAFVLDATGLELLGADAIRARTAPTIITPHAYEFHKLTGVDSATDPIEVAQAAAADLGATVLLKGSTTIVAAPDGRTWLVLTPTGWLATAGTGDVLTGVIGTVVAAAAKRGDDLSEAVAAAAFLHGLAGRIAADHGPAEAAIAADDLLTSLGEAAASIRSVV